MPPSLPALSAFLIQVHDVKEGGKPYLFGPRTNAPCNKYLVLYDGLGNKHTMAMQVWRV